MLVLDPSSHCDVCCEGFSSLPECIDCGHIFCSSCLDAICEKTWSPRQLPACPFCRETFTKDTVRKIRVDLKTPRRPPKELDTDCEGEVQRDLSNPSEAKRLEEKVAKAAANKCSFDEVSELHREIQQWLASEVKRTSASQHASLQLSAALLKAILLNCLSYSEASKLAKNVESNLKERLDTATLMREQLEGELRKCRSLYTQKVRECSELRSEVNRLKLTTLPGNGGLRPLATGIPLHSGRGPSPSPLSHSNTGRSVSTPIPSQIQRSSYLSRPSSTTPTFSNMSGNARGLVVGSAPTSNTMASAMRFQTSPMKSRSTSSWSAFPVDDDRPPERWIPASDNESVVSEKQFSVPPADRFSYGSSSADRALSPSSSHPPKWMSHLQLPPVTI